MTVAAQPSKIDLLENGVTTSFPVPFRFLTGTIAASRVLASGAVVSLAAGTDYSTTGGSTDAGGTLVLTGGSIAGAKLRIRRVTPRAQVAQYIADDSFPAESHEQALDRSMLVDQEQDDKIADTANRALLVPDGEIAPTLPAAADRAGKAIVFDADGGMALVPLPASLPASLETWELPGAEGQTVFTFAGSAALSVLVALNGIGLMASDYTRVGDDIVLTEPIPALEDIGASPHVLSVTVLGGVAMQLRALAGNTSYSAIAVAQAGSVGAKLQQFLNPLDDPWRASGNLAIDDRDQLVMAANDAHALGQPLFITKWHRFDASAELQCDLIFIGGGFAPGPGATVTCRGNVSASLSRIFSGAGAVVGIRQVRPEWWGATGNNVDDDQPALQDAHDCVEASLASRGDRPLINLSGGITYGLGRTWRLRPSASINLEVIGDSTIFTGTRFQPLPGFSAANGEALIHVEGQTNPTQQVASFRIGGFGLLPRTGSACTKALQVGSPGKNLIGIQQSEIFDVFVSDEYPSGFPIGYYLGNFTLIDFNRCSCINRTLAASRNVVFFCDTSASFVGDINFNACRMTANAIGTNSKNVDYSEINVAGAQAKGHRYNDCTFYSADRGIDFSNSGGSHVGDIWINPGTQFDGFQNAVIFGEPSGAGTILDDINLPSVYFRGVNNGMIAVYLKALAGARIDAVDVSHCWFANLGVGARSVYLEGVRNAQVNFNRHTECNNAAGELIDLVGCTGFSVIGNTLKQVTAITVAHLITIGVGSDYGTVMGNTASGANTGDLIQNLSLGTHLTLTPNQ